MARTALTYDMAFMSALSAFVAQNMGAGNKKRADRSLFLAQGISVGFGAVMFLLTFFAGWQVASLFSNDPLVLAAAEEYLRGCSWEYLIIAFTFCFLGYFNGREHTLFVMAQGLFSAFLVRIPLSYFFSIQPNASMYLISLAVPISALVNVTLCTGYFLLLRRKDKRVQHESK